MATDKQLQAIADQIKKISSSVDTLAKAEKAGMKIGSSTSVADANKYLSSQPQQQQQQQTQQVDTRVAPPGISQQSWNQLDPATQAALAGIQDVLAQQLEQGRQVPTTLTAKELEALYEQAQKDPVINDFYRERLRVGEEAFKSDLQYAQGMLDLESQQNQRAFEDARKDLARNFASKGLAYSGFRGQAQERLAKEEEAVIQSSRQQLQKALDDATKQFEAKYGTGATLPATMRYNDPIQTSTVTLGGLKTAPTATSQYLTGKLVGDVVGTEAQSRLADIEDKYQSDIASTLQQRGATQ